ncbi:MAG: hypothetical protein RLZZ283_601 [Candidatus Parcubacteria bacterium]
MTMMDSIRHPFRTAHEGVVRYSANHVQENDRYLWAESHGERNANLPLDREYEAKMAKRRANDERVERLQALPGLPADPVQ